MSDVMDRDPSTTEEALQARIMGLVQRLKDSGKVKHLLKARAADPAMRILAAEDNALFGTLLRTSLAGTCKLEVCETGWRAAQMYLASPPDVLLLDLQLGDLHGKVLLEAVMRYDPDPYVIIISGNSYSEDVTEMLDSGAKGFVAKPFNLSMLAHHLGKAAMFRNKKPHPTWA